MRLLTGSVLALLLGGVAYLNLNAPVRPDAREAPVEVAPDEPDWVDAEPELAEVLLPPLATGEVQAVVVDGGGAPLAGIGLTVEPQGGGAPLASGETDAAGVAVLGGLEPGLYQLRVVATTVPEGLAAPWQSDLCRTPSLPPGVGSPCFSLLEGDAPVERRVELVRPSRIEGTVLGLDGLPASDAVARIAALSPGLEAAREVAPAGDDGRWSIALAPGEYRVVIGFRASGPNAAAPRFEPLDVSVAVGETLIVPQVSAAPSPAPVADVGTLVLPVTPPEPAPEAPSVTAAPEVELSGRVLTTFGEPLGGIEVAVAAAGAPLGRTTTGSDGTWSVSGLAPDLLTVTFTGERLLGPAEPARVRPQEGQRRVRIPDVLLEVRREFRLEGRVVVDAAELDAYRAEMNERTRGAFDLDEEAALAAYLRGLRLERRNVGAERGRPLAIAADGAFDWTCALPAEDVELVLTARGARAAVRGRSARLLVTPAGDRTVRVELQFPPDEGLDQSRPENL